MAQTKGDGAGYDVRSFTDEGVEKFIEVKTPNGSKRTPFLLSANELYQSGELNEYWLYRLFKTSGTRKVVRVPGPVNNWLDLTPTQYRATVKAAVG